VEDAVAGQQRLSGASFGVLERAELGLDLLPLDSPQPTVGLVQVPPVAARADADADGGSADEAGQGDTS
jgi:hypothetical protein